MTDDERRAIVFEALDHGVENAGPEYFLTSKPISIALDLIDYDSELEDECAADLIPHIVEWQRKATP